MTFGTQRYVPGIYTRPLSEDFVSDGPWVREFCKEFIPTFKGSPFQLEEWQADLIDHVLELYPDDWPVEELRGKPRYTEVVICMGRQNGKSIIGAVLALWGLFYRPDAWVVGLASKQAQAKIVFDRVKLIVDADGDLSIRFKTTSTRGITRIDGEGDGIYQTEPALADSLNGIDVTLCIFDEVHLCDEEMWSQMVLGTSATKGMVLGITTAGDDSSLLLKNLYKRGKEAVYDPLSRFGFFLWQAPEGCAVDDPEGLLDANPSMVDGHLDLEEELRKVRSMPESHARRYRLNQFVTGGPESWLPMQFWYRAATAPVSDAKQMKDIVFSVDRTPSWENATITVTGKLDGKLHTDLVVEFRKPNREWLLETCQRLNRQHRPMTFVMDGYMLGDLANELKQRGAPVEVLGLNKVTAACSTAYALIAQGKVTHGGDKLLSQQMPFAVKKNVGDAWRINRAASSVAIDAVMSTVFGIYIAETKKPVGMQLF